MKSRQYISVKNVIAAHPIRALFVTALVIRLSLALIVAVRYNGTLFADDNTYLEMVKSFASSQTSEWSEYQEQLWNLSLSFLLPSTLAYQLSGSNVFAILTLSALVGSLIPALLSRLLHQFVSLKVAVCVGAALAIMPSQVLWSSVLLKDTYIALGFIAVALTLGWWISSNKLNIFVSGSFLLAIFLIYIQRIRLHSLVVVCIAVVASVLLLGGSKRLPRLLVATGLLLVMPWSIGGGIAGIDFARGLSNGLEGQRIAGAIGANTAVVPTNAPSSSIQSSSSSVEESSSSLPSSSPIVEELKYLPSGLKVMLLDPTVSQLSRSRSLYFAFAEHIIWYPALLLALYGAVRRRNWTIELVFSALLFLGLSTMWALAEGNFGTAFRHRTEFVWVVFLFAGLGIQQILDDRRNLSSSQKNSENAVTS